MIYKVEARRYQYASFEFDDEELTDDEMQDKATQIAYDLSESDWEPDFIEVQNVWAE